MPGAGGGRQEPRRRLPRTTPPQTLKGLLPTLSYFFTWSVTDGTDYCQGGAPLCRQQAVNWPTSLDDQILIRSQDIIKWRSLTWSLPGHLLPNPAPIIIRYSFSSPTRVFLINRLEHFLDISLLPELGRFIKPGHNMYVCTDRISHNKYARTVCFPWQ